MRRLLWLCVAGGALAAALWLWSLRSAAAPNGTLPAAVDEHLVATAAAELNAETARHQAPLGPLVHGRFMQRGRVVAGATVIACRGSLRDHVELYRTQTDERGVFEQPSLDGRFWFAVLSDLAPRKWVLTGFEPTAASDPPSEVEVPLPGRIEGYVVDARGNPVAGAEVTCFVPGVMRFGGGWEPLRARAALDGRFAFARLHEGEHRLQCVHDGYAVLRSQSVEVAEGKVASATIELGRGSPVHGVVLDWRGNPLPSAVVDAGYERLGSTDASGRFSFPSLGTGCSLRMRAPGHVEGHAETPALVGRTVRVKLERAVTLRGVVNGANGRPGTVELVGAKTSGSSLPEPRPYALLDKPLPVGRDGRFEVAGLACSDYDVTIRIPGVGTVGPERIALREDVEQTFEPVPGREIVVAVQDQQGRPVEGAELMHVEECREDAARYEDYPSELLLRSILRDDVAHFFQGRDATPHAAQDGEVRLWLGAQDGLVCVMRAPGFADVARAVRGFRLADRLVVTMPRVGSLRGVVTERSHRGYARYVEVWPAGEEFVDKSETWIGMHGLEVGKDGGFFDGKVLPGSYRAALRRAGHRHAKKGSRGTPLIDDGPDLSSVIEFAVTAGVETRIELPESRLGVLRGTVRMHGAPAPGVAVMATRQGWQPGLASRLVGTGDWDEEWVWQGAPGQLTDQHGRFRMLYRKAGPVELRARHPDGHATAAPITIVLPPPGEDVVQHLHVGTGAIRGRVPSQGLAEPEDLLVTLFPLRLAGVNALADRGGRLPLCYYRPKVEGTGGAFEFSHLDDGVYIVRAQERLFAERCLWQRAIEVHGGLVDLGDVSLPARVDVTLPFTWSEPPAIPDHMTINSCWLWQSHGGRRQAVWVATVGASSERVVCGELVPGRYTAAVGFAASEWVGWIGPTSQLSKPVTFEVRSDGSIEPSLLVFAPQPAAPPGPAEAK